VSEYFHHWTGLLFNVCIASQFFYLSELFVILVYPIWICELPESYSARAVKMIALPATLVSGLPVDCDGSHIGHLYFGEQDDTTQFCLPFITSKYFHVLAHLLEQREAVGNETAFGTSRA